MDMLKTHCDTLIKFADQEDKKTELDPDLETAKLKIKSSALELLRLKVEDIKKRVHVIEKKDQKIWSQRLQLKAQASQLFSERVNFTISEQTRASMQEGKELV
jgi:chaperonin cofactor prefoldin